MPGDGQRGPGRGGTGDRGRPGAGQARQHAGGDSPPGDGQDHAGTPRPDALIPALDQGQLAALHEVGRGWDRVSADPVAFFGLTASATRMLLSPAPARPGLTRSGLSAWMVVPVLAGAAVLVIPGVHPLAS